MTDDSLDVAEIRTRYSRIATGFDDRIERLSPADFSTPTPCTAWDVRGLITHVVEVHRAIAAMVGGGAPQPVGPEEDLVEAWRDGFAAVEAAVSSETAAVEIVETLRSATMPFAAVVGGLLCADTIVHTWDLARATGQDDRLDPAGVAHAFATLQGFGEGIRAGGAFGPAIEPPAGADEQTRLVCFCGRRA
ncbi:MAG: TIGR03086 family metal-binding protein [Sporichthyaceae bacterium]